MSNRPAFSNRVRPVRPTSGRRATTSPAPVTTTITLSDGTARSFAMTGLAGSAANATTALEMDAFIRAALVAGLGVASIV